MLYHWDIDIGQFEYVPDNQTDDKEDEEKVQEIRKQYETGDNLDDVF